MHLIIIIIIIIPVEVILLQTRFVQSVWMSLDVGITGYQVRVMAAERADIRPAASRFTTRRRLMRNDVVYRRCMSCATTSASATSTVSRARCRWTSSSRRPTRCRRRRPPSRRCRRTGPAGRRSALGRRRWPTATTRRHSASTRSDPRHLSTAPRYVRRAPLRPLRWDYVSTVNR